MLVAPRSDFWTKSFMVSQKTFFKRYSLNNILVRSFENSRMLSALSLRSPVNRAMHEANTRFLGVDPHCWDFSASPSKGRFRTESMFKEYLSSETAATLNFTQATCVSPGAKVLTSPQRTRVLGSNGAEKWHREMLREQQSELQLLTSFHNIHRLTSVEGE